MNCEEAHLALHIVPPLPPASLPSEGKHWKVTAVPIGSASHARGCDGLRLNGDGGRDCHLKRARRRRCSSLSLPGLFFYNKTQSDVRAFVYLTPTPSILPPRPTVSRACLTMGWSFVVGTRRAVRFLCLELCQGASGVPLVCPLPQGREGR